MSSFQADLERALEASAAEARADASRPFRLEKTGNNDEQPKARTSFSPPLEHHFRDRVGRVSTGVIIQAGAFDQFHNEYAALIAKHGVASSEPQSGAH